ncbi:hypothetical protein BC829DRAFT_249737 [Chytridium lagenaria]|nr:hypothetical protein BC829DRAFT_249737 [Chytridium lagenaria]
MMLEMRRLGMGVKEITYRRMWRFGEGVNSVCVVDVEGAALLASSVTQPLGVSMPARRGLRRRTLSNTSLDEVIRRDREARLLDDDYVAPPGGMSPSPATPSLTSSTLTSSMSLTSSISVTSAASKISEPRALPSPARLVRRRASMEFEEDPPSIETARCLLVGLERGSIVELDISAGAPTPRLSSSPHPPPPLITPFPAPLLADTNVIPIAVPTACNVAIIVSYWRHVVDCIKETQDGRACDARWTFGICGRRCK